MMTAAVVVDAGIVGGGGGSEQPTADSTAADSSTLAAADTDSIVAVSNATSRVAAAEIERTASNGAAALRVGPSSSSSWSLLTRHRTRRSIWPIWLATTS